MTEKFFPGDQLRQRREEMGITVADAFRKLRIPLHCIQGLEAGDMDALPELCYSAGFLKTYCHYLGLDPKPFVHALQTCMEPPSWSLGRSLREGRGAGARWLQRAATWAAISVVLLIGWLAYAVVFRPQAERGDDQVEAGAVEMRLPAAPDIPAGSP